MELDLNLKIKTTVTDNIRINNWYDFSEKYYNTQCDLNNFREKK